jgi:hypothetical protein
MDGIGADAITAFTIIELITSVHTKAITNSSIAEPTVSSIAIFTKAYISKIKLAKPNIPKKAPTDIAAPVKCRLA